MSYTVMESIMRYTKSIALTAILAVSGDDRAAGK